MADVSRSARRTEQYFVAQDNNDCVGPGNYIAHTRIRIRPGFSGFASTDRKKTSEVKARTSKRYPVPGPGSYLTRTYVTEERVKSNAFRTKVARMAPNTTGSTVFSASSVVDNPGPGVYSPQRQPRRSTKAASASVGANNFGSVEPRRSPFPDVKPSPHAAAQQRVAQGIAAARAKLEAQHRRAVRRPRRGGPGGEIAALGRFATAGGASKRAPHAKLVERPALAPTNPSRRAHTPASAVIGAPTLLQGSASLHSGSGVDTVGPDRYAPGFTPRNMAGRRSAINFGRSKEVRAGPFAAAEKHAANVPASNLYAPERATSIEQGVRANAYVQRRLPKEASSLRAPMVGTYLSGTRAAGPLVAAARPMPRPSAAFSSRVPNIETSLLEKNGRKMPGPGEYSLRRPNPPQSDSDPLGYRTGVVTSESAHSAAARAAARAGCRVLSTSRANSSSGRLNERTIVDIGGISPIRSGVFPARTQRGRAGHDAFGSGMKRVSALEPSKTSAMEPGPANYNSLSTSFTPKRQTVTLRGESVGFASTASRPCLVEGMRGDPNLTPGPGPGAYDPPKDLVPLPALHAEVEPTPQPTPPATPGAAGSGTQQVTVRVVRGGEKFAPAEQAMSRPFSGAAYVPLGTADSTRGDRGQQVDWKVLVENKGAGDESVRLVSAPGDAAKRTISAFGSRDNRWRGSLLSDDEVASHGNTPGPGAYDPRVSAMESFHEPGAVAVALGPNSLAPEAALGDSVAVSASQLSKGVGGWRPEDGTLVLSSEHPSVTAPNSARGGSRSRAGSRQGQTRARSHSPPQPSRKEMNFVVPPEISGVAEDATPLEVAGRTKPTTPKEGAQRDRVDVRVPSYEQAREDVAREFYSNPAMFIAAAAPGFYPSSSNSSYFNRRGRFTLSSLRKAPAWGTAPRFGNSIHAVAAGGAVHFHMVGQDATPGVGEYSLRREMPLPEEVLEHLIPTREQRTAFAASARRWGGVDDHFAAVGSECKSRGRTDGFLLPHLSSSSFLTPPPPSSSFLHRSQSHQRLASTFLASMRLATVSFSSGVRQKTSSREMCKRSVHPRFAFEKTSRSALGLATLVATGRRVRWKSALLTLLVVRVLARSRKIGSRRRRLRGGRLRGSGSAWTSRTCSRWQRK